MVSAVWASFPLGILVGGLLNGFLLTQYSWEAIYLVGGILPLVVAALLVVAMPESLSYLASHEGNSDRIGAIMARVGLAELDSDAAGPSQDTTRPSGIGLRPLLARSQIRATLGIWAILFMCFGTTATMSWVPTMLHAAGTSVSAAAVASSSLGLGALIGMAIAGRLLDRYSIKALLVPVVLGAGATAVLGYVVTSPIASSVLVGLVGMLVGMGASSGIALATLVYPPVIRSTGTGWAMSLGRLGQVALPGLFGILLAQGWSAPALFIAPGGCSPRGSRGPSCDTGQGATFNTVRVDRWKRLGKPPDGGGALRLAGTERKALS